MKSAALISFALHVALLFFLSMNLSNPFKKMEKDNNTMVIDFVRIDTKTAAPKLAPDPTPKEEKKETKKKDEPQKEESVPKKEEPKPAQEAKPKEPEVKKPEPKKPEPKKEDAIPDPTKKVTQKKTEPKKKEEPVKPKETKKPTHDQSKKEVKKTPEKAQVNLKKKEKSSKALDDLLKENDKPSAEEGARANEVSDVVTASQIDAIRSTIRKCWFIPAGLRNMKDLSVDVQMEIAEDGTVTRAEVVDKGRMQSDSNYRTAAEAARRAVLDPACNPLPLPAGKHHLWKDLEMTFNPKDMF